MLTFQINTFLFTHLYSNFQLCIHLLLFVKCIKKKSLIEAVRKTELENNFQTIPYPNGYFFITVKCISFHDAPVQEPDTGYL